MGQQTTQAKKVYSLKREKSKEEKKGKWGKETTACTVNL